MVVASPDYLARHGTPAYPEELIHHECLAYTGVPSPHSWEFQVDGRSQAFPIRARLQGNSGEALVDAAVAGFGLAAGPTFIAGHALATGAVQAVLGPFVPQPVGIYAVLPGNRHVPHRVRVLMDFLAERLGPAPPWEA